jgi:quinol monooxygenase YgiN
MTILRSGPKRPVLRFAMVKDFAAMESRAMADKTFAPAELNDGFVVAIEIDAKVGEEQAVADALGALIVPTMAEPGVKLFLPYRSPTDPKAFFVFELYRNEAGWAEHQNTDHFKAFVDKMLPRIARRERVPFVPNK